MAFLCEMALPRYHWRYRSPIDCLKTHGEISFDLLWRTRCLFAIEMLNPVQEAVIHPFTAVLADVSTAVILPFDDTVIAQGRILRDATTGFAVSIEAGCNGVEAAIVLIAGIVAFPASIQHKVIAILAGFLFVQALNIVRIISLFYLGQWNYTVFEWFHLYLWPVLIMLDVLVVFAIYLQWLGKQHPETQQS